MRFVLKTLLLAVLVGCVAWWLAGLPGHLSGEIGLYTIETSTPAALLALILLLGSLYALIRLIVVLIHLPRWSGRWRAARRRRGGEAAITRALVAIAAATPGPARREAHKARALLGDTPQTLLLASEAARLADRDDEAEAAFLALTTQPDAALLGFRGLYRLAVARQDWAAASRHLTEAERAHPAAQWLAAERAHVATRTGDWAAALSLPAPDASRAAMVIAAAVAERDPRKAAMLAKQAWKLDPALPAATLAHVEALRRNDKERAAQAALRHGWRLAPHPDLAIAVLAPVMDPLERAKAAQRLTSANPDHMESRLLLAQTALEAGLTGEARHQAEAAVDAGGRQRRLFLLLADIAAAEGRATEPMLRQAAAADPDPMWRCEACHTTHVAWQVGCAGCGAVGRLRWVAG